MFFDILISLFVATIIVALGTVLTVLIVKTTIGKMAAVTVVIMLVLFSVALATGHAEEKPRTCWVEEILFCPDVIRFIDEDGEYWDFDFSYFGENLDVKKGDEYTLLYNQIKGTYRLEELP